MPEICQELPAVAGECAWWLPRRRRSAGVARGLLRGFLAELDGGGLYEGDGELVLSELVGNAVRHARVPADRLLLVRFELRPGQLRLEVHDAGRVRPVVREVGPEEECGRGLWLVKQLSLAWGCCPRAGGVGQAVWALVGPSVEEAA